MAGSGPACSGPNCVPPRESRKGGLFRGRAWRGAFAFCIAGNNLIPSFEQPSSSGGGAGGRRELIC